MAPKNRAMMFRVDIKAKSQRKVDRINAVKMKLIKFGDLVQKRPPPPPQEQLPLPYINFLLSNGGNTDSLQLIIVKRIEMTDTKGHQARLSLPKEKIRKRFLSDEEEEKLKRRFKKGERDLKENIIVKVVDPRLVFHEMNFVKWNDDEPKEGEKKKSWWYALTSGWIDLMEVNGLQEGDAIQVWSFRFSENNNLGFIIQKVDEGLCLCSYSSSGSDSGFGLPLDLSLGSSSNSSSSYGSI